MEPSAPNLSSEKELRQRYDKVLGDLVTEAVSTQSADALAAALAWTIARMIDGFGVSAAGDLLSKIGSYIGDLSQLRRAKDEAQRAREEGAQLH
jgi:hypothetical protein